MTIDNFRDVGWFHDKFGLDNVTYQGAGPRDVPPELLEFRRKFLHEELDEFEKGMAQGDHAQMADALVDLVYVAMGTAHLMGYPWHQLWDDVQRANMAKVRVQTTEVADSERGGKYDVVKPPGWMPPDAGMILTSVGFTVAGWKCGTCEKRIDTDQYYQITWNGEHHRFDSDRCLRVWRLTNGAWEKPSADVHS